MLVVDKYYQIVVKSDASIPKIWRVLHATALVLAAISGFVVSIFLEKVIRAFGENCVLNAELKFTDNNLSHVYHFRNYGNFTQNLTFHNGMSTWGDQKFCEFMFCSNLSFSILAIIFLVYVAIATRSSRDPIVSNKLGLRSSTKSYVLVLPGVVISGIMFIYILTCGILLNKGMQKFCEGFKVIATNFTKCDSRINEFTLIFNEEEQHVSYYIKILHICVNCTTCFWLMLFITLIWRLFKGPDFKIIIYTLTEIVAENDHFIMPEESHSDIISIQVAPIRSIDKGIDKSIDESIDKSNDESIDNLIDKSELSIAKNM